MESLNKKLTEKLVKGKEYATQLQELHRKPVGDDGLLLAKELLDKILRSFTESIPEAESLIGMCQIGSPDGGRSSQDTAERKRPEAVKYRRGCYKRRRADELLVVKVTATMEDGHAWRKYGQKEILNCKYPRCYFRCTHKYDQGCRATKQVQRVDHAVDTMYQTTYFGNHTCEDTTSRAPQIILDYCSDFMDCLDDPIEHSSLSKEVVTRECKEGTKSDDLTENKSSSGSTAWQDLIVPGSPSMGSYHDEVVSSIYTSGSTSLNGWDMRSMSFFSDFDDHDFPF